MSDTEKDSDHVIVDYEHDYEGDCHSEYSIDENFETEIDNAAYIAELSSRIREYISKNDLPLCEYLQPHLLDHFLQEDTSR